MAIDFVRIQYVKRSCGQNACAKSAYISREKIHFQGNNFQTSKTYDWSYRDDVLYKEIILPKNVNPEFAKSEKLWNLSEAKENRKNSQTAIEGVFALPDDLQVSLDDKIALLKSFVQEHFVSKGLAAEIAIHPPDKKLKLNPATGEIENLSHNWHAHALFTTRRFKENGEDLEDKKARDLFPDVRNGKVISGTCWHKLWGEHQNKYFIENGMSLRVDPNGLVSQIHLGPKRLRGQSFELFEKNENLINENQEKIKNPSSILNHLIKHRNIFSGDDIRSLLSKFSEQSNSNLFTEVISLPNVVKLFECNEEGQNNVTQFYTTLEVLAEEKHCFYLADKIFKKDNFKLNEYIAPEGLNLEQRNAFDNIVKGKQINFIEGHAGTGKSYLLAALKKIYETNGYTVRALGPDSATAEVLKSKGFNSSSNVYKFLFDIKKNETSNSQSNYWRALSLSKGRLKFNKSSQIKEFEINNGKEVWFIDESTKLGNEPFLQILKMADKYNAKLVFAGGALQMLPVERGAMFQSLTKKYGSEKLENIQRQNEGCQREISNFLAKGDFAKAINKLSEKEKIIWIDDIQRGNEVGELFSNKYKIYFELVNQWAKDQLKYPSESYIITACTNSEVRILNELAREIRKEKSEVSSKEYECTVKNIGKIFVSEGDRIEFTSNSKRLGVTNGLQGTLIAASENLLSVLIKEGKTERVVEFNPKDYNNFKHGYATTYFRSQGKTVDRAYILHSHYANKEMFYVNLTRHVNNAYLFVSKSSLNYFTYLKAKAQGYKQNYNNFEKLNNSFKNKNTKDYIDNIIDQTNQASAIKNTLNYTTKGQIEKLESDLLIKDLKQSSSIFDKLKGHALDYANKTKSKLDAILKDGFVEKADKAFYSPNLNDSNNHINLKESFRIYNQSFSNNFSSSINWDNLPNEKQKLIRDYFQNKNLLNEKTLNNEVKSSYTTILLNQQNIALDLLNKFKAKDLNLLLGEATVNELRNYKNGNKTHDLNIKPKRKFIDDKLNKIDNYRKVSAEANLFYSISSSELKNETEVKSSTYFAWQASCSKRNKLAYEIINSFKSKDLIKELGINNYNRIIEQSNRYETLLRRKENNLLSLEDSLKNNIEGLLYRLFPEGPSKKSRNSLRFGSKGSLVVSCEGDKKGSYFNFENGTGGGPLRLIQETLNFNFEDVKVWASSFLGESNNKFIPSTFKTSQKYSNTDNWISIKPDGNCKNPPSFKELSKLSLYYNETARYTYKNEKGETLFYILRLTSKEDNLKKIFLPLSFGIDKSNSSPTWSFKAYQTTNKPLYNLNLLTEHPNYKVLLVEGEKTADAANALLLSKGIICLTWSGGASAVSKSNWKVLENRDVVIWPDNDKAGFNASKSLVSELRKINCKSIACVDETSLKLFPNKWDLADKLPKDIEPSVIKDIVLNAKQKSTGIESLQHLLGKSNDCSIDEKKLMKQIIGNVENRLWDSLEIKLEGSIPNIRDTITNEAFKILSKWNEQTKEFLSSSNCSKEIIEAYVNKMAVIESQYGSDNFIKQEFTKFSSNIFSKAELNNNENKPHIENKNVNRKEAEKNNELII